MDFSAIALGWFVVDVWYYCIAMPHYMAESQLSWAKFIPKYFNL
jgi:hypothetical protein